MSRKQPRRSITEYHAIAQRHNSDNSKQVTLVNIYKNGSIVRLDRVPGSELNRVLTLNLCTSKVGQDRASGLPSQYTEPTHKIAQEFLVFPWGKLGNPVVLTTGGRGHGGHFTQRHVDEDEKYPADKKHPNKSCRTAIHQDNTCHALCYIVRVSKMLLN